MFESINYRGKPLTKYEVLKNRLIYLTEIITQSDQSLANKASSIRKKINNTWGTSFRYFGNGKKILAEDDFLLSHSIMYFGPTTNDKDSLDTLLFKKTFSIERLANKKDNADILNEINKYSDNICLSSELWAAQHCSILKHPPKIIEWLQRMNRLGFGYFKPIVLAGLNKFSNPNDGDFEKEENLEEFLYHIERYIFIIFHFGGKRAHFGKNHFSKHAHNLFKNQLTLVEVSDEISKWTDGYNDEGEYCGDFNPDEAMSAIRARFYKGKGFYDWAQIKYFLSEYEHSFNQSNDEATNYKFMSVEHIMPTNPAGAGQWFDIKKKLGKRYKFVVNDLGNLTLLPRATNQSAQNIDLKHKSKAYNMHTKDGRDIIKRAGKKFVWDEEKILERGEDMIRFLLKHWDIQLEDHYLEPDLDDFLSKNIKPIRKKKE